MRALVADRIVGAMLFIVGVLAVFEAVRLRPLNDGRTLVGDETFIGILGVALIIVGGFFIFVFKSEADKKIDLPIGPLRKKMFFTIGLLFLYWILLDIIGYPASTFIAGLGLFRTIGDYGWPKCVIFALLVTLVFYGIFVLWLETPFPHSQIGFF